MASTVGIDALAGAALAHVGRFTMAKILILTGDAAELLEVMYPYQRRLGVD